ncbi:MAG: hypothetical protein HY671_14215 [Chloroflexi bacterium]|nr:hypothetical protein [Chloroflexota bacterium]
MSKLRLHLSLFFSLALLPLMPITAMAQATEQGVIQGQVVNRTPNGKSVADIPIELKTAVEGKEKSLGAVKTDAQGRFRFAGLSTEHSAPYQASLTYQEADYFSDVLMFAPGEASKSIELPVWDATEVDPGIRVTAAHVIVQFDGVDLKVTEYYRIENPGDKTYVGSKLVQQLGKKETLRFSLPPDVQVEQLALGLMDCCVAFENDYLIDTIGVEPGVKEIAFVYLSAFNSPKHVLPIVANLPTDTLSLVVEDKGVRVSSPQLSAPQSMKIEDMPVLVLSTGNLKKGQTIQATLAAPSSPSPVKDLRWIGIGLMVIALGFGIAYPLMRRRASAVPTETPAGNERQQLLEDVARLDDSYEAGQITEDDYRTLRSDKMARLMELARQKQ